MRTEDNDFPLSVSGIKAEASPEPIHHSILTDSINMNFSRLFAFLFVAVVVVATADALPKV